MGRLGRSSVFLPQRLLRRAATARRLSAIALLGFGFSPLLVQWRASGCAAFLAAGPLPSDSAAQEPTKHLGAKVTLSALAVALVAAWNCWHAGQAEAAQAQAVPVVASCVGTEADTPAADKRDAALEAFEGEGPLSTEIATQILERADLLSRLTKYFWETHAGHNADKLHFGSFRRVTFSLAERLGAKRPEEGEVFASFLEADRKSTNYLSREELSDFCVHLIGRHLAGLSLSAELPSAAAQASFQPVARAGDINLTVSSLVGAQLQVSIDHGACGADLKAQVAKLEGTPEQDQRLLCHGAQLENALALHAMGLKDGDVVLLVRVPAPPEVVELRATGRVPADVCYRVVCSRYTRTELRKDGRPIYRGGNQKYLYFQEQRGRWCISDDGEWSGFEDNSWGFCLSSGAHPGELVDLPWHVSDSTYRSYVPCENVAMEIITP